MKFCISTLVVLLFSCSSVHKMPVNLPADSMNEVIKDYEKFKEEWNKDLLWPNHTPVRLAQEYLKLSEIKKRIENLEASQAGLTVVNQINADILKHVISDRLYNINFNTHWFPLSAEGGMLAEVIYTIRGVRARSYEDYQKYLNKLKGLPLYFKKRQGHLEKGMAAQKMAPKLIVGKCIELIDHLLSTPASETFFVNKVKDTPERKAEVAKIVEEKIFPAYSGLRQFLKDTYLPQAPESIGISDIKDGKAYYEQRVKYFTTDDISPKEVFDIGQAEVKRIRAEMESIIEQLAFEGSFADFLQFLRTDPQFYPKSGEELLHKAAWITKRMEGQLPFYFGKLPRMPLTVKPVPDALAPNYTAGRYSPGSYENQKAGEYWVNTYKLESRPYYALPALSLHEGVPGHHLQIMLSAENEDIADFRKTFYLSAFGEGWGLYSEFLGKEAGLYENLYEEFGALTYEMWRACRLVVDPGMHYMGWSREKAYQFMLNNTALSEHEVTTEIDRYIGWPGQAVSYKIGELKIRELRKKAEAAIGDQFDIRTFHDKILENGSVPLFTLERIIDQYIANALSK